MGGGVRGRWDVVEIMHFTIAAFGLAKGINCQARLDAPGTLHHALI